MPALTLLCDLCWANTRGIRWEVRPIRCAQHRNGIEIHLRSQQLWFTADFAIAFSSRVYYTDQRTMLEIIRAGEFEKFKRLFS